MIHKNQNLSHTHIFIKAKTTDLIDKLQIPDTTQQRLNVSTNKRHSSSTKALRPHLSLNQSCGMQGLNHEAVHLSDDHRPNKFTPNLLSESRTQSELATDGGKEDDGGGHGGPAGFVDQPDNAKEITTAICSSDE